MSDNDSVFNYKDILLNILREMSNQNCEPPSVNLCKRCDKSALLKSTTPTGWFTIFYVECDECKCNNRDRLFEIGSQAIKHWNKKN